jgi:hypothetical protein
VHPLKKDVKIRGREILSYCQGEFPKSYKL